MMPRPAQLEVFETALHNTKAISDGPGQDWLEGHAAGFEEARRLAEADCNALSAELVQTLADMGFGFAEAKAELLQQLWPLFDALINRFLPDLAAQSLVPMIRDRLLAMAQAGADRPLILHVAPEQIVPVSDALTGAPHLAFAARSDPSLGAGQAMITGAEQEEIIDLDALLALARDTLSALQDDTTERAQNG